MLLTQQIPDQLRSDLNVSVGHADELYLAGVADDN
jgi:hypothetical protein